MKNGNIIILLLALLGSSIAKGQESFSSVSYNARHNHSVITFSVPREANIYQYRILAGGDSTGMALVGTVRPKENSVFSRNYEYEVYEPNNNYYRVVIVGMDQKYQYSPVISTRRDIIAVPLPESQNSFLGCPVANK